MGVPWYQTERSVDLFLPRCYSDEYDSQVGPTWKTWNKKKRKINHEGRFRMIPLFLHFKFFFLRNLVRGDPGFPSMRCQPKRGSVNLLCWPFSPKTAWKWKKQDRKCGSLAAPPLDPPLVPVPTGTQMCERSNGTKINSRPPLYLSISKTHAFHLFQVSIWGHQQSTIILSHEEKCIFQKQVVLFLERLQWYPCFRLLMTSILDFKAWVAWQSSALCLFS